MATKIIVKWTMVWIYIFGICGNAQNIDWKALPLSSHTSIHSLNSNGEWLAINERDSTNTIKLINTKKNSLQNLGNIKLVNFIGNDIIYIDTMDLFTIKNLKSNRIVYQSQVKVEKYDVSPQQKYIALISKNVMDNRNIIIISLKDYTELLNEEILDFKWELQDDKLLLLTKMNNERLRLKIWDEWDGYHSIFSDLKFNPMKIELFNQNIFLATDAIHSNLIYHLDFKSEKIDTLDLNNVISVNKNEKWVEYRFDIFNENEFTIEVKTQSNNNKIKFHEWNANDTVLPLWKDKYNKLMLNKFVVHWKPNENRKMLFNSTNDNVFYNFSKLPYILRYNYFQSQPSNLQYPIADLFLLDKKETRKTKLIQDHYFGKNYLSISPSGDYIVYFKDLKWYYYDYINNFHRQINVPHKYALYKIDDMYHRYPTPYGIAGWSTDETIIYMYEKNDIIAFNRITGNTVNITNNQLDFTFRFNDEFLKHNNNRTEMSYFIIKPYINEKNPIILDITTDTFKNGIAWLKNGKLKIECLDNFKLYNFKIIDNKMFWIKENYKTPPTIESINFSNHKINSHYQSNSILNNLDFGFHQIIPYKNYLGQTVNGVLLYPTNFNNNNKYPIIFNVYESMGYNVNEFNIPTDYNFNGFNNLKYILNGYFIFLPHFTYQIGNPAKSIVHDIESSLTELNKIEVIDMNKKGLIGHSFGGYEAALIATKTNHFQTIVAGSGVMDLISFYNDIQWETGFREQNWRLVNQQFRMDKGFFQAKENYINNSPFHQVENLNTPLFLWTGKKDYNINWYQSVAMFGAMRNLNKTGKILLFEEEGHNIMNRGNQKKLSNEIYNWFEKYLKK